MRLLPFLCILLLLGFGSAVSIGPRDPITWTREIDLEGRFILRFNNENPDKLVMEISAPTNGYIAVGFSPNGGMRGSDIALAWIDNDGKAHLKDMYAVGNSMPLLDEVNNYELIWAEENQYGTTVRFSRPWNTCDEKHDFEITEDTMKIIWATSPEDPKIRSNGKIEPSYHGPDFRGGRSLFLKVKTHLQKFPDEEHHPDPSVKYWDVRMNKMIVPDDRDTTYYCRIFKTPHVSDVKHQIIGFRTLIDEANKQFVHHMNFFQCQVPESHGKSRDVFEKYLNHPGGHCYHKNMPPEWGQYCMSVPFVWVAGAEGLMLPKEGGIPLGEQHGGTTYFMLEIHYDNPKTLRFEDSSGVRIFVTDKPRPNDIGTVTIHTRFSHGFHLLPPGFNSINNMAFCTAECTQKAFPPEGVTVTHATLHGHLTARKMKIRLIRNGKELEPLAQDDHYDFNYQQSRLVYPSRKLYPGDIIMTECEFDTTDRDKITYGGTSTRDEMCQGYIYFYPRVNLAECKSQYDYDNFFNALGIEEIKGQDVLDRVQLPYKPHPNQLYDPADDAYILKNNTEGPQYIFDLLEVTKPKQSRKTSVAEYVENLPWRKNNNEFIKKVLKQWWNGKHDMFCTGHHWSHIPLEQYSVPFPKFEPYVKPADPKCGKRLGRNMHSSSTRFTESTIFVVSAFLIAVLSTN